MAEKGYRLIGTGKLLYEFEECKPNQVHYCVEFIGEKSKENALDYAHFLEDMGYTVFFKNSNLNYSVGKVRWRPWAEQGGRIATNSTTFQRELLIVEKENDGTPFALHTAYEDQEVYYRHLLQPMAPAAGAVWGVCCGRPLCCFWHTCAAVLPPRHRIPGTDLEDPARSQDKGVVMEDNRPRRPRRRMAVRHPKFFPETP